MVPPTAIGTVVPVAPADRTIVGEDSSLEDGVEWQAQPPAATHTYAEPVRVDALLPVTAVTTSLKL